MFRISNLNNETNYRINPVYQKYAENYKNAFKQFKNLETVVNSKYVNQEDIKKYNQAKLKMQKFEDYCKSTPHIIKGGNLDKKTALSKAEDLHRIDYYC